MQGANLLQCDLHDDLNIKNSKFLCKGFPIILDTPICTEASDGFQKDSVLFPICAEQQTSLYTPYSEYMFQAWESIISARKLPIQVLKVKWCFYENVFLIDAQV